MSLDGHLLLRTVLGHKKLFSSHSLLHLNSQLLTAPCCVQISLSARGLGEGTDCIGWGGLGVCVWVGGGLCARHHLSG